ncbi:MAG: hypothetical protein IT371_18490 [Deltaproteobacteria bacterium]|nr:hypothetical protein [Deltaproteobacteria bacterium]
MSARRTTSRWLLVGALAVAACGDPGVLDLSLAFPEGPDPLANVDQVKLRVTEPAAEELFPVADPRRLSVELETSVKGAVGSIVLEGLSARTLVARGETPPLVLGPDGGALSLLVSRAGELSALKPRLPVAGQTMSVAILPLEGVLVAGGADRDGRPLAGATLYDFFHHVVVPLPALPEPRGAALGAGCGNRCALVWLGEADRGLAQRVLRYDGTSWSSFPDGLEATQRRKGAAAVLLEDGRYLAVGGEGPSGPLATILRLEPGTVGGANPRLSLLPVALRAARRRPAVALSKDALLVAGGQPDGAPAAEVYYLSAGSSETLVLPGGAVAEGSGACALADGRLLLLGGRDRDGRPLSDGWVVDPLTRKTDHYPKALAKGRYGHELVRFGDHVVVIGGRDETGVATEAQVLSSRGLATLRTVPMQVPRHGHGVTRIGNGTALVSGGLGGTGDATSLLELYQTFLSP